MESKAYFVSWSNNMGIPPCNPILPWQREGDKTRRGGTRKEVGGVKIVITGNVKEIAALVEELQERRISQKLLEQPIIDGFRRKCGEREFAACENPSPKGALWPNYSGGAG